MAKDRFASRTDVEHGRLRRTDETDAGSLRALQLVALRGADVLSVKLLYDGGKCWVGNAAESIAKIPMGEFGGDAVLFAEVGAGRCVLYVPPRARGRTLGGKSGLARIVIGPVALEVEEGDCAVVVLGAVQIRARVVPVGTSGEARARSSGDTWRWIGLMAALYVAALAVCALIAPERVVVLERGFGRAVAEGLIGKTNDGTR